MREGEAGSGVRRVLVSPCKLGSPADPRLLLLADVLARWRRTHTAKVEVSLALNHGGQWAYAEVRGRKDPHAQLLRRKEMLVAEIAAVVERLGLDYNPSVCFSLDPAFIRGAARIFGMLFTRGCITRERIVAPWCFSCMTTLDRERKRRAREETIEVWRVLFPLKGTEKKLPVLFRSLELLPATAGVALHPNDRTLAPLIGRTVRVPLWGREVKIYATTEHTLVGKVRPVLPAYEQTDFDLAQANHLVVIDVVGSDGKLNAAAGRFAGKSCTEARELVRQELAELDALGGKESVTITWPQCEICGNLLATRATQQWFVHLDALEADVDRAWLRQHVAPAAFRHAVEAEDGRGKWCVSRQSDWGVPLPVWYCSSCDEFTVSLDAPASCTECGSAAFVQAPEKLSSGFLAAVWPLLAGGQTVEDDEEREPALMTYLFSEREAELAYLTLKIAGSIASAHEPERVAGVKPCTGCAVSAQLESDAQRVSLLMAGAPRERYEHARDALRGFLELFVRASALHADAPPGDGETPIVERWLAGTCRRGAALLARALEAGHLSYLGEILFRFALSPVADVYLPRLAGRPKEAVVFVAEELRRHVLPHVALLAPVTAEEIGDLEPGAQAAYAHAGAEEAIDLAFLVRVRQLLRLERRFDTEPGCALHAVVRGPRTEEAAMRREAEAFGIDAVLAALDRAWLPDTPYRGEVFGEVVLLSPGSRSNLETVIERLRRRNDARRGKERGELAESGEFINELRRVGESQRADDDSSRG